MTARNTYTARLLATLVLALAAILTSCAQVPTLDDGVYKASQMFEQRDYDGVITLLQPMADRDPKLSTTALDLLGMAYFHKFDYRMAANTLERAVNASGMFSGLPFGGRRINMRNHGVLGWCYFHMEDLGRARAAFDKALAKTDFRREPAWDESALRGRGWTRFNQADFQGASADIGAAQRLAKANPDIDNAAHSYYRHLLMAYASLGLHKDTEAEAMARSALALAKKSTLPSFSPPPSDVAPIYLMLGQRDQAYRLLGRKALLGIDMRDHADGASKGVRVEKVVPGSAAQQAGMMPGDIIVAVDGQAVTLSQELGRMIGSLSAGQKVQLSLMRNGGPIQLIASLTAPDAVIAKHELLQPILKVRQLPAAPVGATVAAAIPPVITPAGQSAIPPEPAGTSTIVVDMPPPAREPAVPQVETPVPPELRIESVRVEPASVPAGERFEVRLAIFALDQDIRTETVEVVLRYAIKKDGKELAHLEPGVFQVPNGVPGPLAFTTRTGKSQALGEYVIHVELLMGAKCARAEAKFNIRK